MERVRGTTAGDRFTDPLPSYDFRRSDSIAREHVRALEALHEVFARRLASTLGNSVRALVQLEPVAVDQMTLDDYVRSMPDPTLVGIATVPPLPGAITAEIDPQLALLLVDRLLGGDGAPLEEATLRRPTELEGFLLRDLLSLALAALAEALQPLVAVEPTLTALEYSPQQIQIAAPSEMVVLVSYRLSVSQGMDSEGLLTLGYPATALAPVLERLNRQRFSSDEDAGDGVDEPARATLIGHLHDVDLTLVARLHDSRVGAADIARLRVGDVLRLDHRLDEPIALHAGDMAVLSAHLGRRGRRLAVQIENWFTDNHNAGAPPPHPRARRA